MYSRTCFNPFPNKPWFSRVCSRSLLKTLWEKEKLFVMSNFSFSHSVFYPFGKLSGHFHHLQNCCLQNLSVWKGLKFVVWKRVKRPLKVNFKSGLLWQVVLIKVFQAPSPPGGVFNGIVSLLGLCYLHLVCTGIFG